LIKVAKSGQKRHKLKKIHRDTIVALAFILPGMIVFFTFRLGAVIFSFYISLHKYRLLEEPVFLGFQNFINIARNSIFLLTVKNTAYLVAGTVPAIIAISLTLAIVLNTQLRGRNFFRVLFFSPLMIPLAVAAISWARALDSAWGEWNWLFGLLFITVMSIINISQVFVTPQIMTEGGPARATLTVVLHLYRTGFRYYRMGEAAAMSWLLFGVIFTLTILNRKLFGEERRY